MLFKLKRSAVVACRQIYKSNHPDYLQSACYIKFDHFQSSLPRLPVPNLSETLERYLNSQRALAYSQLEYDHTVKVVNEFRNGIGAELQDRLRSRDLLDTLKRRHNSYVSDVWFSWGYVGCRTPLPLWYNPVLSFPEVKKPVSGDKLDKQLVSATNYIVSTLRFMRSLDNGSLSPTLVGVAPRSSAEDRFLDTIRNVPRPLSTPVSRKFFGVTPIDVSQFSRLFRSSRVPRADGDDAWRTVFGGKLTLNGGSFSTKLGLDPYVLPFEFDSTKNLVKHIVVFSRGSIFKVRVLDDHGCIEPATEIYRRLALARDRAGDASVRRAASESGSALVPFGTTMDRSKWAAIRNSIEAYSVSNQEAFDAIDSALFAVTLSNFGATDEQRLNKHFLIPETDAEITPNVADSADALDAWYDKSFTLLLTSTGRCAVNFEHSYIDGVGIMRLMREVQDDVARQPALRNVEHPPSVTNDEAARHGVETLRFDCDAQVRTGLETAAKQYRQLRSSLSLATIRVNNGGRKRAKAQKVSPDALAQLAFQLSYARLFDRIGAVYESCSTAAFRAGRTETIRSASPATRDFIDAFQAGRKDELRQALLASSAMHTKLVREASAGLGWDRHLLGLQSIAAESPLHTPIGLFVDPAYRRIKHIDVSTSQLTDPRTVDGFAFGPVELDCIGIGYQIHEDHVRACVSCYPQHTNGITAARFGEMIAENLEKLNHLL